MRNDALHRVARTTFPSIAFLGEVVELLLFYFIFSPLWIPGPLPLDCTASLHTSPRLPEVPHSAREDPRHRPTWVCPPDHNHTRENLPRAPLHIGVVGLVIYQCWFAARDVVNLSFL